ncbi:MAG: phosphotransferase enzyme family protein [Promethearchaeota archaeon]
MKPFNELNARGRIRRIKKQAQAAIAAYGLSKAKMKFLGYSGNAHYQIDSSQCAPREPDEGRYWENHYILRLHQPNYQTAEAIRSELLWLQAILQDTDLVVPEPIYNAEGELMTYTEVPGLPTPQYSTLLRWVKGRKTPKEVRAHHYKALGRVAAQLHNHAASWHPPRGFTRIHYDWNGLFSDGGLFDFPASTLWESIPRRFQKPFEIITDEVQNRMHELGTNPAVYGLIHADLSLDTNMLWYRGDMRPIDFDDSAYGYWIYDLAISLAELKDNKTQQLYRDALQEGYTEIRTMPSSQWKHLDLFIGAWHATALLYAINSWLTHPMFRAGAERWRDQEGEFLIQALSRL